MAISETSEVEIKTEDTQSAYVPTVEELFFQAGFDSQDYPTKSRAKANIAAYESGKEQRRKVL